MKSAYELAMEKLEKQSPTEKLTEEEKQKMAEIDSIYQAKIAEREVFLKSRIQEAINKGESPFDIDEIHTQLSREIRRLKEEAELKKDSIRSKRAQS